MLNRAPPDFARVLGTNTLAADEVDAVIEIAYAMAAANGDASFEELGSVRALAKHLRPGVDVAALFDALGEKIHGETPPNVARAAAKRLATDAAREIAYKAAYTVAAFDLETNEEERELDDVLVEALGLSARADAIEAEVNAALVRP
jgi:hypothetical protein